MALQAVKMTVPAADPAVAAVPAPLAAGGGVGIDPPRSEHEGEEDLPDQGYSDDDFSDQDEDDTDDEYVDSDSEFEDDDGQPPLPDVVVSPVAAGFLGPSSRSASANNTAAFMRFALAPAAPGASAGGEILVHYRYTRFVRAQGGGGDGVDTHVLGPKLARVRFHLPAHAADPDPARSPLHFAGAALAPLLYPARFSTQLRALWSVLVAEWAAPRATPTTRVVVTVDVGILRPGDCTTARMKSMVAALQSVACECDTRLGTVFDVGVELLLPATLVKEDDVRPAKRRRVAGEDCPICCEVLEQGLAAWPRCSHIFHGSCLEEHLVRGHQECPMCRSGLQVDAPGR
ncbi:unnamed protein product [Urochloa humidicola]